MGTRICRHTSHLILSLNSYPRASFQVSTTRCTFCFQCLLSIPLNEQTEIYLTTLTCGPGSALSNTDATILVLTSSGTRDYSCGSVLRSGQLNHEG